MPLVDISEVRVAVIGLGYVGLPLAVHLARRFPVVGFDIDQRRIAEVGARIDRSGEVTAEEFALACDLSVSADVEEMRSANFYIVSVPTPIDAARQPDLTACRRASETVSRVIAPGDVVVFESTVYPGATEEVCIPLIERASGLAYNRDFFAGYSPERINPGDPSRRLPDILKVTSGSTPEAAELIDRVYGAVIAAGTHRASSIRVAEAAKVIENIQRDLNIALVNELSQLFKKLGIETREVLEAAGTKWNFHAYRPGLVGGHCIGVDPYYLTHKAQSVGFHPAVILAGRRVNDGMAAFVAHDILKAMAARKIEIGAARLLVMGFTFKENCPDTRNTKVGDLVRELAPFAGVITIWDPYADPAEVAHEYELAIVNEPPRGPFDGVVLAVRHDEFVVLGAAGIRRLLADERGFVYDLKEVLPVSESDFRL